MVDRRSETAAVNGERVTAAVSWLCRSRATLPRLPPAGPTVLALVLAVVLLVVWYVWAHPELLAKFKKEFQDALGEGGGPPESPA